MRRANPDVAIRIPFGTPMIKLPQRRADWLAMTSILIPLNTVSKHWMPAALAAMSICPRAASISTPSPWKVV